MPKVTVTNKAGKKKVQHFPYTKKGYVAASKAKTKNRKAQRTA